MTTAMLQNRFAYQARDQRGQLVQGFVSALTLLDATKALRAEGKYIVDIKPARAGAESIAPISSPAAAASPSSTARVKREEVIHFNMQLSVMVDTGVPLSEALTGLS